ncbi:hypothetical protein ACWDE9_12035 [Streptomyces olivaceoviridis]
MDPPESDAVNIYDADNGIFLCVGRAVMRYSRSAQQWLRVPENQDIAGFAANAAGYLMQSIGTSVANTRVYAAGVALPATVNALRAAEETRRYLTDGSGDPARFVGHVASLAGQLTYGVGYAPHQPKAPVLQSTGAGLTALGQASLAYSAARERSRHDAEVASGRNTGDVEPARARGERPVRHSRSHQPAWSAMDLPTWAGPQPAPFRSTPSLPHGGTAGYPYMATTADVRALDLEAGTVRSHMPDPRLSAAAATTSPSSRHPHERECGPRHGNTSVSALGPAPARNTAVGSGRVRATR